MMGRRSWLIQGSTHTDTDKKDTKNEEFKIDYKTDRDTWKKRVDTNIDNKEKAYVFL